MKQKLGVIITILISLIGAGCIEEGAFDWEQDPAYGVVVEETTVEEKDPLEDLLVVELGDESAALKYNDMAFSAELNWEDGSYYFSPDPEGAISGHRIICVADISSTRVEGDCFRNQRTCHFAFACDRYRSDEKDAYRSIGTTCKTASPVGPFLVPLDAPRCGQDPFPACPPKDLFPVGPSTDAEDLEEPEDTEDQEESIDPEERQGGIPVKPAIPTNRGLR